MKKVFLEISQNSQENTCARVSFLIKLQVFSCEFCEISKNAFHIEHLRTTASANGKKYVKFGETKSTLNKVSQFSTFSFLTLEKFICLGFKITRN